MNSSNHLKNPSPSLTPEQRNYIIFQLSQHKTSSQIKDDFLKGYNRVIYYSTISKLKDKKKETGDVADRDGTDRLRICD